MTMVLIPAGEFLMGSPDKPTPEELVKAYGGDAGWYRSERPQHRVRLTAPLWLGKFEVTQQQWESVMGANPSLTGGPRNPVEQVSWDDCQAFAARLGEKAGGAFFLPTEAQWEYACRAGTATQHYFGDEKGELADYAWFRGNSGKQTHAAGSKKPNPLGLHDMLGNVWEWCRDRFGDYEAVPLANPEGPPRGDNRVLRGGSAGSDAADCRSACRHYKSPAFRRQEYGFRIAAAVRAVPR